MQHPPALDDEQAALYEVAVHDHGVVGLPLLGQPRDRGLRTDQWLYVRNFFPERWPAGDPSPAAPGREGFGDIDGGPTKAQLVDNRDRPEFAEAFRLATGKRPAEELYDLASDPHSPRNLAGEARCAPVRARLSAQLRLWMLRTHDRRATDPRTDLWDHVEYFG
ncbi:hypothetical protein [Streptomyces olivaceus]